MDSFDTTTTVEPLTLSDDDIQVTKISPGRRKISFYGSVSMYTFNVSLDVSVLSESQNQNVSITCRVALPPLHVPWDSPRQKL